MLTPMDLTKRSHRSCTAKQGPQPSIVHRKARSPRRAYMVRCNAGLHGAHLFPISKYPSAHEPHAIPDSKDRVQNRAHAANKLCSNRGKTRIVDFAAPILAMHRIARGTIQWVWARVDDERGRVGIVHSTAALLGWRITWHHAWIILQAHATPYTAPSSSTTLRQECAHRLCSSTLAGASNGSLRDKSRPAEDATENTAEHQRGQRKDGQRPRGTARSPSRPHSPQQLRTASRQHESDANVMTAAWRCIDCACGRQGGKQNTSV